MFLVAGEILEMDDPVAELRALGWYMFTVILGLGIHGFLILPLIYYVIIRRNPYPFIWGISEAMVTAFGTASRLVQDFFLSTVNVVNWLGCKYSSYSWIAFLNTNLIRGLSIIIIRTDNTFTAWCRFVQNVLQGLVSPVL